MKEPKNETGVALGLGIIGALAGLWALILAIGLPSGPLRKDPAIAVMGVHTMFWGLLFLASYYYSHKCFFLRGLIWICEHFSRPSGRRMALSYFALMFGMGVFFLLIGLGVVHVM